jgi:hypothetical protein
MQPDSLSFRFASNRNFLGGVGVFNKEVAAAVLLPTRKGDLMPSNDAQRAIDTLLIVEACQRELQHLQDVLAEFKTSNEQSMQFLAMALKTEEEDELPQDE